MSELVYWFLGFICQNSKITWLMICDLFFVHVLEKTIENELGMTSLRYLNFNMNKKV